MAILQKSASVSAASAKGRTPTVATVSRRCAVVVRASQDAPVTGRREVLGGVALSMAAALVTAAPAQAFLGFGDDGAALQESYAKNTTTILDSVRATLALDRDDPTKEDKVKELRKDINSWVATYRREPKVSGRPSYGQTYSVLNALAGHYNSFGATAPIPKKRLERINKELEDATLYLSRGR